MIKSQEVVTPLAQTSSNLDEIEKLSKLFDKGIITKEEFEAKKTITRLMKRILNK